MKKKTWLNLGFWVGITLLTGVGFWLRFAHLGNTNFQNDEFFHLEAAVGYLQTGHYALWDFGTQQVGVPYTRAWIYTWQVVQTFQWFGVSEWSARLPSVLWGVLLLPLMGWLGWRVTQSRLVALFAVTLAVFDQSLIWSSRTCRMYSLYIFLVCLTLTLVVESLKRKPRWWVLHPVWFGLAVVTFWISYMAHESALALGAGVIGVVAWLTVDAQLRHSPEKRRWRWLSMGLLVVVAGTLLVNWFITPILPNQFITLRTNPNWEYGLNIFNQLRLPWLGWPLFGVAVWATIRFKRTSLAVLLATVLPIIFFFVFIGNRYAEKKYILFILPFVLILVAYGLERAIWTGLPTLVGKLPRWILLPLVSVVFLVVGVVPSWPGIPATAVSQTARADRQSATAEIHDFKSGYALIESKMTPERKVILIQGSQSYYWTKTDLNLISLKSNKGFTLAELKSVVADHEHGFIVWPRYKSYHLRYDLRAYVHSHFKRLHNSQATKIQIFIW